MYRTHRLVLTQILLMRFQAARLQVATFPADTCFSSLVLLAAGEFGGELQLPQ